MSDDLVFTQAEVDEMEAMYVQVCQERDAALAEVQRLRVITNDVLWLTRLAVGSSWPGEMAEQVERAAARIRTALDDPKETTDDPEGGER